MNFAFVFGLRYMDVVNRVSSLRFIFAKGIGSCCKAVDFALANLNRCRQNYDPNLSADHEKIASSRWNFASRSATAYIAPFRNESDRGTKLVM